MSRFTFYIDNLKSEHQLEIINFRTKKLGHTCNVTPNLPRKEITITCMKEDMQAEVIVNALSSIGFKARIKDNPAENKIVIKNRKDVQKLVYSFYSRIRKDDLLSPIFNGVIAKEQWPAHLEKMIDFWEMNLFYKQIYRGNPPKKHIGVDEFTGNKITQTHFDRWLKLWRQTLDEEFEGELAIEARKRARNIAKMLLMKVLVSRGEKPIFR